MSTKASATYENTAGTETAYDEPVGGSSLLRASVQRRFQGALTGESVAEVLVAGQHSALGYICMAGRASGIVAHSPWEPGARSLGNEHHTVRRFWHCQRVR